MIERLSSNHFSSQTRNADSGVTNIQMQERLVEYLPEAQFEEKTESVTFPKEKVEEIVSKMNKFMENSPTSLKFEFHEKLNEYFVKIVDDKTKEVVREIPPKKMLDFYAAMTEFLGLMVDKKV
ncbi:flagellar protein FlaG [Mesobacillus subterraneus]|uniref:Flagellar protein FlaG n=1 Tax=Mesobacillus subterraneus TaxID=285983 RepID=A0A427TLH3_9BACI|nr:flagellar protein FlaG [Mesobacillus subterraneus]RSD25195.1 flagellar protein FlaG [Mesobacillus subterraneus]